MITKEQAKDLLQHSFQVLLVAYLLLLLLETIKEGTVSNYLNLNYLLVIVIIFGVATVLWVKPEEKKQEPIKKRDYYYIGLLSIAGILIIFYKTKQLGWLAYMISAVAGILIFLLSYLVLTEENEQIDEK